MLCEWSIVKLSKHFLVAKKHYTLGWTYTKRYPEHPPNGCHSQLSSAMSLMYQLMNAYQEFVRRGCPRDDGALVDHTGAVHVVGVDLIDAVEVKASCLVAQGVLHVDYDRISHRRLDRRTRPLPIDADDWSLEAIRRSINPSHLEVVGDGRRTRQRDLRGEHNGVKERRGKHGHERVRAK
jgi:hypothetical protein